MSETRSRGGQTTFTRDIADQILDRMGEGESLRSICRDMEIVASTVIRWVNDDRDGFGEQYAKARECQAHALADQLLEIADTTQQGVTITTEADGSQKVVEGDMIAHRRLRYDARKWLTSKILPKVYGDKTTTEVVGANGGPVQFEDVRAPIAALITPVGNKGDDE